MVVSEFKSEEEIAYLLKNKKRLSVFSCTACANLSGSGGPGGLEIMNRLLKKLVEVRVILYATQVLN